jgi:hypothetical protein
MAVGNIGNRQNSIREDYMGHHTAARRTVGAVAIALGLATSLAVAQDTPVRVRGTIEQVDGQVMTIKGRDGAPVKVTLADNGAVVALVKSTLADIKPGGFVGVTALPQVDGSWQAVEVHIFPESMRGVGEGDRPWDLHPKSTMTNGAVAEAVTKVDGRTVTLKYKEGEKTIQVTPATAIVTYVPGDKGEFIPGATKQPDGTLQTMRVNVGRDGVTPPM